MDGVKAHVEGNKTSIAHITALLKTPSERARLKEAIQNPNTSSAKRLLNKYLKHLIFSSQNVSYGILEGSKLKCRLMATSYRCSAPTCFLTISPSTVDNPRSVRLAIATSSNMTFPSVFEDGCELGSNGDEFLDNMMLSENENLLSEGFIQLPRSKRAELAIENPVAFVHEYKILLNDILEILGG
jgi:hypothetical protein